MTACRIVASDGSGRKDLSVCQLVDLTFPGRRQEFRDVVVDLACDKVDAAVEKSLKRRISDGVALFKKENGLS